MKSINKRTRKIMRVRNRNRVNRLRNQQLVLFPVVFFPVFILVMIRLALEKQNTAEKLLARLRLHIEKLTGNLFFPVTEPSIADLQLMADNLESDIDAIAAGNKALIPNRNNLEKDGKEMIRQLSYNIQFLSKGDEEQIKSAGFDVRKVKSSKPLPGQVLNLVASAVGPGKIRLKWDKEDNSTVYVIEQGIMPLAPNTPMIWEPKKTTRNVTFVVENLIPGQLYYFRVFGTNGNVNGNPSDPAEQRSL